MPLRAEKSSKSSKSTSVAMMRSKRILQGQVSNRERVPFDTIGYHRC